jgi:hypothetical protein
MENEMGRECSSHRRMRDKYNFFVGNAEGKRPPTIPRFR